MDKTLEAFKAAVGKQSQKVMEECQIKQSTLYAQLNGTNRSDLHRLLDIIKAAPHGLEIVKHICSESDGYYVPNCPAGLDFQVIPDLLKEFGELVQGIGEAEIDGKITQDEYGQVCKEASDLKGLLDSYLNDMARRVQK